MPELEIPVMFCVLFLLSPGGGGVMPYMGFKAVYSRIGYINQNIWV